MNYLLFANDYTGKFVLKELRKNNILPKVIITKLINRDSLLKVTFRAISGLFTLEDKLRYFYSIEFYDYRMLNIERLKKIILANNIEIGFITTFSYKIPNDFFNLFTKGVFNIHPSLLPKHGGADPFFWIILNNETENGTTLHKATDVLDYGEIYLQTKYKVVKYNSLYLLKKYSKDCAILIKKMISDYDKIIQSPIKPLTVIYDPNTKPSIDKLLEQARSKDEIRRIKRAYTGFYSKRTKLFLRILKVFNHKIKD